MADLSLLYAAIEGRERDDGGFPAGNSGYHIWERVTWDCADELLAVLRATETWRQSICGVAMDEDDQALLDAMTNLAAKLNGGAGNAP